MSVHGAGITECAVAVVEDDGGMREAIRRVLEVEGLGVESFGSAEDFLASGAASRTDCLVLDVGLPGLSGFDLHEQLAAAGVRLSTVFITAHDDTRTRRRAFQRSSPCLVKPFRGETLIGAIRLALSTA